MIFATHSMDALEFDYTQLKMSLGDLAKKYNCTRQYIYKLLKEFDIKMRDKATAREIALSQGKIIFQRIDELGNNSKVSLQKIALNKNFFKSWSPAMAYVLGIIFTDGNLIPGSKRDSTYKSSASRFSVSQKEPELLRKILALMECNAKLYLSKQRATGNPIYEFHINDEQIYEDLLKLGLTPKKSLTMQFPEVPSSYVRHFVRGCWDGDGSVFIQGDFVPGASYVSGSRRFVDELVKCLVELGLPAAKIYSQKRGRSHSVRFMGEATCAKLYHVFYDDVPETMYLSRKFERFKTIAAKFEGGHLHSGKAPFAFPGSLTRSALSRMLGISPAQVTSIMTSSLIGAEIKQLANNIDEETIKKVKRLIIDEGILFRRYKKTSQEPTSK